MGTDFGKISTYIEQKGFGFVRGLLAGNVSEFFFHIKTLQRTDSNLASRLLQNPHLDTFFWFEAEKTQKGNQVRRVLTRQAIQRGDISDPTSLIEKIERLWRSPGYKPIWLEDATTDLLGHSRAVDLALEREHREYELHKEHLAALKESEEKLDAIEKLKQAQIEAKQAQRNIEQNEFDLLVSEIRQMGFSHSSQVSNYIVSKRLGLKYRNISGVLQMELNGSTWNFNGGFPPNIYARLCDELDLSNKGTKAKPLAFESFDSIEARSRRT